MLTIRIEDCSWGTLFSDAFGKGWTASGKTICLLNEAYFVFLRNELLS
jgi:hypothetical protein